MMDRHGNITEEKKEIWHHCSLHPGLQMKHQQTCMAIQVFLSRLIRGGRHSLEDFKLFFLIKLRGNVNLCGPELLNSGLEEGHIFRLYPDENMKMMCG